MNVIYLIKSPSPLNWKIFWKGENFWYGLFFFVSYCRKYFVVQYYYWLFKYSYKQANGFEKLFGPHIEGQYEIYLRE